MDTPSSAVFYDTIAAATQTRPYLAGIIAIVAIALVKLAARYARNKFPKSGDDSEGRSGPQLYQPKHVEDGETFDTIIIGSGIGGLSVASLLAQHGQKVLVLEQHSKAGGACHMFEHNGYRFATGIHYVGEMGVSKLDPKYKRSFKRVLDTLTMPDDPVIWDRMKDDPFESIVFGSNGGGGSGNGRPFSVCTTELAWKTRLQSKFPHERPAIDAYFALVHQARETIFPRALLLKSLPYWMTRVLIQTGWYKSMDGGYHKLATLTVQEGLEQLVTTNRELQAVLTYHWGDYGCQPDKACFLMNLLVTAVFLDGGFYPHGGPSTIPQKIIRQIYAHGGKVWVKAPVRRIVLNHHTSDDKVLDHNGRHSGSLFSWILDNTIRKHRVTGVEMQDGNVIHCRRVVSDAGLINTIARLLPQTAADKRLINLDFCKMGESHDTSDSNHKLLHPGDSPIMLFVGLPGHWRIDWNLPAEHVWIYAQQHDTSAAVDRIRNMSLPDALHKAQPSDFSPIFIGNPCAKDRAWDAMTSSNRTVMEVICLGPPWKWFEPYLGNDADHADKRAEYESIKQQLAGKIWQRVIQVLNSQFGAKLPVDLNQVDHLEIGTPLTLQHYLRAEEGAVYGLDHDVHRFEPEIYFLRLRPMVPEISGLYLTGQDIVADSLEGALCGGLLCAASILNVIDPMSLAQAK